MTREEEREAARVTEYNCTLSAPCLCKQQQRPLAKESMKEGTVNWVYMIRFIVRGAVVNVCVRIWEYLQRDYQMCSYAVAYQQHSDKGILIPEYNPLSLAGLEL